MVAQDQKSFHIAMFPWLAFGHIIPFLDLSKLLARKGHRISFLSTPRNIDRLPKLPADLSPSMTLVKLPLPKVPDLPENAEATMDLLGTHQMGHLKKAFDGLETGMTRFLEESNPDWIIHDFTPHWLQPVASRLGISRAMFNIVNAWFLAYFGPSDEIISGSDYRTTLDDFTVPPKWVTFRTPVVYRRFEAKWIIGSKRDDESGFADCYRLARSVIGCDAVLVRHCHEFEPEWLTLLEELYHKPIIPLGLMPPPAVENSTVDDGPDDEIWARIGNWLDGQNKGTVVYVALGSEVTPSQDHLIELAHGLELSGVPFFWVLRKTSWLLTESDAVELPCGFEERVQGRGVVWRRWAPQLKILGHDSVGGFLTHCGWSSIVEGLTYGRPLITLPFLVDQGLNSRVVAGKELGVEIPRNEEDGSYTRNSVADSVKKVMLENSGKKLREKAEEIRAILNDAELHGKYTDNFIEFLEVHMQNKSREI